MDIPADGFAEYLFVAISVQVIIGHLESQAQVKAIIIQRLLGSEAGPADERPHLHGAGDEYAGFEADHTHILRHGNVFTFFEIHIQLLSVTYLRGGLGKQFQGLR